MRVLTTETIREALGQNRLITDPRIVRAVIGSGISDRVGRRMFDPARARAAIGAVNDPQSPGRSSCAYDKREPLLKPGDPLICTPGNIPQCNAVLPAAVTLAAGAAGVLTWNATTMNFEKFRPHGLAFYGANPADPAEDVVGGFTIDDLELRGKDYLGDTGLPTALYGVNSDNALELIDVPDLKNGGANLTANTNSITTFVGNLTLFGILYGEALW